MKPVFEERPPQPFLAISGTATREDLPQVIGGMFGELSDWIGSRGIGPVGPPFVRYLFVDDSDGMPVRLQTGFPVAEDTRGDARVEAGVLPGGRYLVHLHHGPWCGLRDATAALLDWAEQHGVIWDVSPDGKSWAARLEIYHTDPESEPDPEKWRTGLAFLTRGTQPRE